MKQAFELILGSTSPRRKEILEYFSLPFYQMSPQFDETSIPFTGNPEEYVKRIALGKLESLKSSLQNQDSILVTCDTIVFIDGTVLGKPKDENDAFQMLTQLSGRWHSVFTALALYRQKKTVCQVAETKVHCNTLSPADIHRYYRAHLLNDKAGSYAIQKSGSLLIKEIIGCYYNVMGLPIGLLKDLLQEVGCDLWDYLKPF